MKDYNTKNKSFIGVSNFLKEKGIQNYDFMLELKDESIQGLDYFNEEDLTAQQKIDIVTECKNNFWFFLREIVKISLYGKNKEPVIFPLTRATLPTFFLYINNFDIIKMAPRQSLNTTSSLICLLWSFFYHNKNSCFNIVSSNLVNSRKYTVLLKSIKDELPSYLKPHSNSQTELINLKNNDLNNKMNINASGMNENKAKLKAKSINGDVVLFEDFQNIKFNKILYTQRYEKQDGIIGNSNDIVTVYPTPINSKKAEVNIDLYNSAVYAYKLTEKTEKFIEEFYDKDILELKRLSNNRIFIKSSVNDLFLNEKEAENYISYMKSILRDQNLIDREIYLKWDIQDN